MKKCILLGLPLVMILPLLLLVLGAGNAKIEAAQAACATTGTGSKSLGIGTLSWPGASHYKKNPHPGERPYSVRVPNMVSKIGTWGASIVGFQEFEPPQAKAFLKASNGAWTIVAGKRQGKRSTADAMAYQPRAWKVNEVRDVPIMYGGPMIQVPLVRFTSTGSLGSVWVLNTPDRAESVGGTNAMRDAAVRAEAQALRQLQASEPNTPLSWAISKADMHSDHPALFTRMSMNGAGPGAAAPTGSQPGGTRPAGCPPCPTSGLLSVVLPNVAGTGSLRDAKVAAAAAYQAGFRGEDLVTAVAIARVESTWNPRATNGSHYGLWQIAGSHQGKVPGWNKPEDIFDPLLNAKYAYALYQARPGSGEAKFADWVPFEKEDYRKYLDISRQAVATTAGTAEISNVSATGCEASPMTVAGELSADLSARVNAMLNTPSGLCALSWTNGAPCTYDNQCPKVVDAVYGGPGVGRGYGNGQDVTQGIINAGLAQAHGTGLDPLPPVGAVVSYNTGNGVGHVAIYVGNGKIFGNDYGCSAEGVYGCVGFADVHAPGGSVTWALPKPAFDRGGMPSAAA